MLRESIYVHYRQIRETVLLMITIGTAALLNYIILWMRL